jgi:hypothetical protein
LTASQQAASTGPLVEAAFLASKCIHQILQYRRRRFQQGRFAQAGAAE